MKEISKGLWAIEEVSEEVSLETIKVFQRVTLRSKFENQWYNAYRWDLMHPKQIPANCRSAIAKAGYGHWRIFDWKDEKKKILRSRGYTEDAIELHFGSIR